MRCARARASFGMSIREIEGGRLARRTCRRPFFGARGCSEHCREERIHQKRRIKAIYQPPPQKSYATSASAPRRDALSCARRWIIAKIRVVCLRWRSFISSISLSCWISMRSMIAMSSMSPSSSSSSVHARLPPLPPSTPSPPPTPPTPLCAIEPWAVEDPAFMAPVPLPTARVPCTARIPGAVEVLTLAHTPPWAKSGMPPGLLGSGEACTDGAGACASCGKPPAVQGTRRCSDGRGMLLHVVLQQGAPL